MSDTHNGIFLADGNGNLKEYGNTGGGSGGVSSADDVSYDNASSGLSATNVQAAIDEVVVEKASQDELSNLVLTGTTNTSGATIAGGTCFVLNGDFVTAKADIASGATFTLNTNYEKKSVGSILTELNSNLGYKLLAANVPCGTETPFAISANKYIILAYYASTSIEFEYVPLMGSRNINNGFFVTSGSGDYARFKATKTGLNVDVYEHNGQPVTSSSTYTIYYR